PAPGGTDARPGAAVHGLARRPGTCGPRGAGRPPPDPSALRGRRRTAARPSGGRRPRRNRPGAPRRRSLRERPPPPPRRRESSVYAGTSGHHGSPSAPGYPHWIATPVDTREIAPEEVQEHLNEPDAPLLVDVRTDRERRVANIPGSVHVPMAEVETRLPEVAPDPSRPIVTFCATGNRSLRILPTLAALGYEDARSMAGGIVAWQALGYPTDSASTLDDERIARYSRH